MKLFQAIVDWSQRQPHWWCRQMAILGLVATLGYSFFQKELLWVAVSTPCGIFCVTCMWLDSRDAARCARSTRSGNLGSHFWFRLLWLWAAIVTIGFLRVLDAVSCCGMMFCVSYAMFQSFAMCKPPAPPKPKHKFHFAKGTA